MYIYIYTVYICQELSGYMLQIWFAEFRPLLQNRASVHRPPFVGPFEFQG